MKSKTVVLIDGDIIAYQTAAANEIKADSESWADYEAAVKAADKEVDKIVEAVKADAFLVALTDSSGNFRKAVYPRYKANRAGATKPLALAYVRAHLQSAALVRPLLEADDVLGIWATTPELLVGRRPIIASIDKDLLTVPGRNYNWRTEARVTTTKAQANGRFLAQCLTGDSVDGYPGLPGVGPKRAAAILSGKKSLRAAWEAIEEAYVARGLTPEDAITQARLARILRAEDYDYSRGVPILWTPPKPE